MKRAMRARFVPSYYSRDLLNKLQHLRQGNNTVEDYYQELQTGLLRCGLEETEDAKIAIFLGGLNRNIQDILDYKEYNSITRLFHLACKVEREVQGRQSRSRGSFGVSFVGRQNQAQSSGKAPPPAVPATPSRPPPPFGRGRPASTTPTPWASDARKSTLVQQA